MNRIDRREELPDRGDARPERRDRSPWIGDAVPRNSGMPVGTEAREHHPPPVADTPHRGGRQRTPDSPDTWRAAASIGMLVGILLIVLCTLLGLFFFWRFRGADGAARVVWMVLLFSSLGMGAAAGYLLHGLTTIRYVLGQDRLIVRWMRDEQTVHFTEIIDTAYDPRTPIRLPGWEPFWPGYYVSTKRTPSGIWRSVATEEPRRRVRIATTRGIIAISPARPVRFIVDLDRRRAAVGLGAGPPFEDEPADPASGPLPEASRSERDLDPPEWSRVQPAVVRPSAHTAPLDEPASISDPRWDEAYEPAASPPPSPSRSAAPDMSGGRREIVRPQQTRARSGSARYVYEQLFRTDLLGDRVASNLIAVGVVFPLLMAAYLFSQFEGVSNPVPLHWDALGDIDRVGQPSALWLLPIMGAIVLIVNTFAATLLMAVDRFLSRLILLAVPIVQLVAFVALVRLVTM